LTAGILLVLIRRAVVPRKLRVGAILWGIAAIGLALLPWIPSKYFAIPIRGAAVFSVLGIAYAISVAVLWQLRRVEQATVVMGGGMMFLIAILFGMYFDNAFFLRLPQTIGEKLREMHATAPSDVIMTGFTEPSLAFYQGGTIRPRAQDFLAREPAENWPTWIVLTSQIYESLPPQKRDRLEQIASYRGFNYNIPAGPVTVMIARTRKE